MLKIDHRVSHPPLLQKLINNDKDADVIILAGPEEKPIYAHSLILKSQCEYFEIALSDRWKGTKDESQEPFTISKPNISYEIMMIIIKLLYTAQCKIPSKLAFDAVTAARELLLNDELVKPCMDYIVNVVLAPENAFKFYTMCYKWSEPEGAQAIYAMTDALAIALVEGHQHLTLYDIDQLKDLIKSSILSSAQKWRIALHWILSTLPDTPLEIADLKDIAKEPHNEFVKSAVEIVLELLPFISIFRISAAEFERYVLPALDLFPSLVREQLCQFYDVKPQKNVPNTANSALSTKRRRVFAPISTLGSAEDILQLQHDLNLKFHSSRTSHQWKRIFSLKENRNFNVELTSGTVLLFARYPGISGIAGFYFEESTKVHLFIATYDSKQMRYSLECFLPRNSWTTSHIKFHGSFNHLCGYNNRNGLTICNDLSFTGTNDGTYILTVNSNLGNVFDAKGNSANYLTGGSPYLTDQMEIYWLNPF
ncbi:hypothetical protein HDV05_003491 [Chytridiales sp. JEL 0842]|nr:hypothetical protein HDV05_003491 [Chytridiales sp. JEL 0842]